MDEKVKAYYIGNPEKRILISGPYRTQEELKENLAEVKCCLVLINPAYAISMPSFAIASWTGELEKLPKSFLYDEGIGDEKQRYNNYTQPSLQGIAGD